MQADYDTSAPKRPVKLPLNADLVARTRGFAGSLSDVVESLLVEFLSRKQAENVARAKAVKATVTAWNTFGDEHGSFADEYPTL